MKNIEKYKNFVLESLDYCELEKGLSREGIKIVACKDVTCEECKERWLKWLMEECKEPVLSKAERKYLSAVIKPFGKRVKYIAIWGTATCKQFVHIELSGGDYVNLPSFKADTMYKLMEPKRHYSLEELGL